MTGREIFRERRASSGWLGLACMAALAALWLALASRVHLNTSWSDGAWGYLALPLLGAPGPGDAVLFDPPGTVGSEVPYRKTVRGVPGDRIEVGPDRIVTVAGIALGRAKTHALDGRPLEAVAAGTVPAGHVYVHGEHPDSHDSRYAEIGLVPVERIRALAPALPDLPWLGLDGPLVGPEDGRARVGTGEAGARAPAGSTP